MSHIREEDGGLDDLLDAGAGLLKDGLKVGDALLGLLGDRALNELAIGGQGDLAGEVDGIGGLDSLGLHDGGVRGGRPQRYLMLIRGDIRKGPELQISLDQPLELCSRERGLRKGASLV